MSSNRFLGLAVVLLTLAGCGGSDEGDGNPSPLPVELDAFLIGASCGSPTECPRQLGYRCVNYYLPDGTETPLRCQDPRKVCAELGCPDTCLSDRSSTPTLFCPG